LRRLAKEQQQGLGGGTSYPSQVQLKEAPWARKVREQNEQNEEEQQQEPQHGSGEEWFRPRGQRGRGGKKRRGWTAKQGGADSEAWLTDAEARFAKNEAKQKEQQQQEESLAARAAGIRAREAQERPKEERASSKAEDIGSGTAMRTLRAKRAELDAAAAREADDKWGQWGDTQEEREGMGVKSEPQTAENRRPPAPPESKRQRPALSGAAKAEREADFDATFGPPEEAAGAAGADPALGGVAEMQAQRALAEAVAKVTELQAQQAAPPAPGEAKAQGVAFSVGLEADDEEEK
jgi:hypothetical protein